MSDRLAEMLEAVATVEISSTRARLAVYKKAAGLRGYDFELTDEEADVLFKSPCHYCGLHSLRRFNGIDRVVNKVGYVQGNVVACCRWCNLAKGSRPVEEFQCWLDHVRGVTRRPLPGIAVERIAMRLTPEEYERKSRGTIDQPAHPCGYCRQLVTADQGYCSNICLESHEAWLNLQKTAPGITLDYDHPDW